MPKYNLKHIYYALLAETTGSPVYSGGRKVGDSVSADINISNSDSPYYAEGKMRENKRVFTGGTIGLAVSNLDKQAKVDFFGRTEVTRSITVDGSPKSIPGTKGSGTDEANNVGVAFAEQLLDNEDGTETGWYVIRYNKVKFAEPPRKPQQIDGSVHYDDPTTSGTIMEDIARDWYEDGYCDTEAEAILWIRSALNITA